MVAAVVIGQPVYIHRNCSNKLATGVVVSCQVLWVVGLVSVAIAFGIFDWKDHSWWVVLGYVAASILGLATLLFNTCKWYYVYTTT
jgi:hypothetical protein